jgi:hypothetical protein
MRLELPFENSYSRHHDLVIALDWAEKAGAFWIILSLVSGRMDHGPIRFKA